MKQISSLQNEIDGIDSQTRYLETLVHVQSLLYFCTNAIDLRNEAQDALEKEESLRAVGCLKSLEKVSINGPNLSQFVQENTTGLRKKIEQKLHQYIAKVYHFVEPFVLPWTRLAGPWKVFYYPKTMS